MDLLQSHVALQMVRQLMSMKIRLLIESLVTVRIWTDEWLLSRVDAHVGFQIEVERKSLVAEIALVWFFTGVNKHVSFELGVVEESLTTAFVGALEELVAVDCVMLFQTCSVVEDFST